MVAERRIRVWGVAAAAALLALAPATPASAASKKHAVVFKPAHSSRHAVTFKLRGVNPRRVLRASLVNGGHVRRHVAPSLARKAARRGVLRVRVRSSHARHRMGRIVTGHSARKATRLWVGRRARSSVKLRVVTDTRAPETTITSGPSGTTDSPYAELRFRSDEKRSSFECRLDGREWSRCWSPAAYSDLADGDHSFAVRARDRHDNVDQTPATRDWTVGSPAATEPPVTDEPAPAPAPAPDTSTVADAVPTTDGGALFSDSFTGANGVITNHYAFWSPDDKTAYRDPNWEMESGCALRQENTLWTGVPTSNEPNKDCSNGSGSEIFRFWSKANFGDVSVSFNLRNNGFVSGAEGERSWDGVKIWLRRQGGSGSVGLYTVEVNRRQGNILIQKKCAGSTDYLILNQDRPDGSAAQVGSWEKVGGIVKNRPDGSVYLAMVRHGETVLEATDTGEGCAPLTSPGRVGIRGDYTNFNADDFLVVPAV